MSEVNKSDWDVASNPIIGYADSYRQMARTGATSIDVWSIITDLERNIAPLMAVAQSELAALREELAECKRSNEIIRNQRPSEIFDQRLIAAEQRNADLIELTRDALKAFNYHPEGSCYNPGIAFVKPWSIRAAELIKPTESGASE